VKAVQDEGASAGEPVDDPAEIAFRRLLAHFPSLTLAVDPEEVNWRPSALHHGLRSLPVRTV
jgi:cytochrome P450